MSIKELTADKHREAETTAFMQAVFKGTMDRKTWADFIWQKAHFYRVIEFHCNRAGYLDDLPSIQRAERLGNDYIEIGEFTFTRKTTHDYMSYLNYLDEHKMLAHLYVWHMGDLFGGQMMKRVLPGLPHTSLDFDNADLLKANIRAKITDDLADEANVAFDWAIKLLHEYDDNFHN
jgi:heme oxygenase